MSQLKIEGPIRGTTFGAVVTGVDLAHLSDADWTKILDAFHEYGILVFPGQNLDDEAQTVFGLRFGQVEEDPPDWGEEHLGGRKRAHLDGDNTNFVRKSGETLKEGSLPWLGMVGNEGWHTDSTYMPVSSKVGMLQARKLPSHGGQTGFCDMRAAYDALDQAMKDRIANLSAYHSLQYSQGLNGAWLDVGKAYGFHGEAFLRPLVKVHPVTGRKAIFAGRHAFGVLGMRAEESERFLEELNANACQPPRVYEHTYEVGDLVIWDERCTLHRARPFDYKEVRQMRTTRIAGDPATEKALEDIPEARPRHRARLAEELTRISQRGGGAETGYRPPRAAL